jgi:hypothetical protein
MRIITSILLSLLLVLPAIAKQGKCVYPVADSNDETPSPPSVIGTILAVTGEVIEVKPDKSKGSKKIKIDMNTELFTVFGGIVERNEIMKGQYVYVWYVGCDPKKAGSPPRAAVIQFYALDSSRPTQ